MKTTTIKNGFLFVKLSREPGHKRYQNVFDDYDEEKRYTYETDAPTFIDAISEIERNDDHNTFIDESVELVCNGEEPTDAELERYNAALEDLHSCAETAMIAVIKLCGKAENLF